MIKSRLMVVIGGIMLVLGLMIAMGSAGVGSYTSFQPRGASGIAVAQMGLALFGIGFLVLIVGAIWKFVAGE